MTHETHLRSIAKALTWRFMSTFITFGIVYAVTGEIGVSAAVGGIDMLIKIGTFFMHERLWSKSHFGKKDVQPVVLWLTGLSGAGKSTIADALIKDLRKKRLKVEHLDGDSIRSIFPSTGFSPEERERHIMRVGHLASVLERQGVVVVASFVSPYVKSREFVRSVCKNFIEIYVSTPLDECERRDVKGLYLKAREGKIKDFTGIHSPYEPPAHPELTIDTRVTSVDEAVELIRRKSKLW